MELIYDICERSARSILRRIVRDMCADISVQYGMSLSELEDKNGFGCGDNDDDYWMIRLDLQVSRHEMSLLFLEK